MNVGDPVSVKPTTSTRVFRTGWFTEEELVWDVDENPTHTKAWWEPRKLVGEDFGVVLSVFEHKEQSYVKVMFTDGRILLVHDDELKIEA